VTFTFSVDMSSSDAVTGRPVLDLSVTLGEAEGGAYIQSYELRAAETKVLMSFDAEGRATRFIAGARSFLEELADLSLAGRAYLVPWIDTTAGWPVVYQPFVYPFRLALESKAREELVRGLEGELAVLLGKDVPSQTIANIAAELGAGSRLDTLAVLVAKCRSVGLTVADSLVEADPAFQSVMDRIVAAQTPSVLMDMDMDIASFLSGVAYLAPQRSVGERLHPRTEAAVEDVHPRGENLADFLASLSDSERTSLAEFTRRHLSFEVRALPRGTDTEILVKETGTERFVNIADVGFGYAEVLPLCVALWSSCVRDIGAKRRRTSLLAIEQPELHLHPAHQAKLAWLIADAWQRSHDAGREVKIMVETHSEGIVNRMGDLIQDGVVKASDVQILFFDQDPEDRHTTVRVTGYAEDGALREDWPFGFFAPLAD
jgi:hypothetical protein